MVLPPLPIAVARASGELVTLCTEPHAILVEDPIANELDPKVRSRTRRRARSAKSGSLAEQLAVGVLVGAGARARSACSSAAGGRSGPKPVADGAAASPWVVALEELEAIRRSDAARRGARPTSTSIA